MREITKKLADYQIEKYKTLHDRLLAHIHNANKAKRWKHWIYYHAVADRIHEEWDKWSKIRFGGNDD
jgi:hypothetical protein